MIEVKNLRKDYKTHKRETGILNAIKSLFNRQYETKYALRDVNLNIKKGEIVGLIGPNGAGKSTLIKILSGVLYPTEGKVDVMGFTPWEDRRKYVANLGVVFGQKPQLNWDLPPVDSFYLNKDMYWIPFKVFKRRMDRMVKLLKVGHVINTPVRDLSLGERMKCKLIAALLHNPPLVFLDEPSIGLDIIAKDRMRDFILETNRKHNTTFIVTTHDMQDVEKLCKRIIIINHGRIIYDGPFADIRNNVLSTKVIEIKFSQSNRRFRLKGCRVLGKGDYDLKIAVDLKKIRIRDVIDHIISNYDFLDMFVTDPPIEEIIQKFYEEK